MFQTPAVVRARLRPLLLLALAIMAGWWLLDTAVFRSGFYYRYVAAPDSTAGEGERALLVIHDRFRPGMANVLVLGDSRTAEGFSAKLANATVPDINFIEAGMAGTSPRVWDYLLRKVDPERTRFSAVVLLQVCDTTAMNQEDLGNRALDLAYLPPLLTWNDSYDLPRSFPDPLVRRQAWQLLWLPGQTMRADMQQWLQSPRARLRQVRANLRAYVDSRYDYVGQPENLNGVRLDPATLHRLPGTQGPGNIDVYLQRLQGLQTGNGRLSAANAAYDRYWFGDIAAAHGQHRRRIFLFTLPRGPFDHDFGSPPHPDLSCIGQPNGVTLLAPRDVGELERPQFYFDGLHMNQAGRERFTPMMARTVAAALKVERRAP